MCSLGSIRRKQGGRVTGEAVGNPAIQELREEKAQHLPEIGSSGGNLGCLLFRQMQ